MSTIITIITKEQNAIFSCIQNPASVINYNNVYKGCYHKLLPTICEYLVHSVPRLSPRDLLRRTYNKTIITGYFFDNHKIKIKNRKDDGKQEERFDFVLIADTRAEQVTAIPGAEHARK